MKISGTAPFLALALCVLPFCGWAQTSEPSGCNLTIPSFATHSPNIFNDRQEQDLGDALAEHFESTLTIAAPPADDQLTRIGERLLATLPPTGVHYTFRVYDSGEVNAESMAGGHVYVSRKLLAAVQNEDELVGVVAHEIGHIYTHQGAIEFTRALRIRLGVTQVGDRADIFAKVHQFFNTPRKPQEEEDKEEKDQLVADRVGLYAVARAGYAPESFASFLDKVMLNKGKTGTFLTTDESTKRYRTAMNLIAELPMQCRDKKPGSSEAFQAWQKRTAFERVMLESHGAVGDRPLELDPPLRPSLSRLRFSPDGRFVLGQDSTMITVMDKNAAKVLFRIEAPNAEPARFTPDSTGVVFNDNNLRVERWDVATGKRTSVKELVVFGGCKQTLLAPDGKSLVCVNLRPHDGLPRVGLQVIDVESGKAFFDKPAFYEPSPYSQLGRTLSLIRDALDDSNFANLITPTSGRYFIASVGGEVMAYDLEHRQPVVMGGKFRNLEQSRMSFMGEDQVVVLSSLNNSGRRQLQVLSFPDGKLVQEMQIGDQAVGSVTKGKLLLVWPLKDYPVGLLDVEHGKLVSASKFYAMDAWDSVIASEDAAGSVTVEAPNAMDNKRIALPLGRLPDLDAFIFSNDGKYLAFSMSSRARIWNLETGKEVGLIRPFKSVWMDENDNLFGQFPKYVNWDAKELEFTMPPLNSKELAKLEDKEWQYRDLEYRMKPIGKATDHSGQDNTWWRYPVLDFRLFLKRTTKPPESHATLEVKTMQTQVVAWSRDYQHETPLIWKADGDRMALGWDLDTDAARDEIKNHPALKAEEDALKNKKKGILIETVVPETGAPLQQAIIAEADRTGGWDDERWSMVSGDYVLVRGEHRNTAIYKLDDGSLVGDFFGLPLAANAALHLIVASNREDEILLVDMTTGKELKRFTLGSMVKIANIVNGKEKMLQVLTADQVVHRLPLPE